MKWTIRLLMTTFISIGIALGLTFLASQNGEFQSYWPVGKHTFSNTDSTLLTQDNLVDLLVQVPLRHQLRHVEWDRGILAVDMAIATKAATSMSVYADLQHLAAFSFLETDNVKQLLVRVLEPSSAGGNSRLLVALDGKRTALDKKALESLASSDLPAQDWFQHTFRMTYTEDWREMETKAG